MTRLVDWLIGLLARIPHSIIALIGRLAIGLVFWNSGRTKVDGWNIFHVNDRTLFLFKEEYKLPYRSGRTRGTGFADCRACSSRSC